MLVEVPRNRQSFAQAKSAGGADNGGAGGGSQSKWDRLDEIFEAFVGNVSYDSTEEDLTRFFEPCGNLIKVKLLKGKAFAKFRTKEALDKCVALNG